MKYSFDGYVARKKIKEETETKDDKEKEENIEKIKDDLEKE